MKPGKIFRGAIIMFGGAKDISAYVGETSLQ